MKKVRKISVIRSGLKTDKLDIDNKTIALLIPKDINNANKIKKGYEKSLAQIGVFVEYQKSIHYKRPFWKFWGIKDYDIAVFKIIS